MITDQAQIAVAIKDILSAGGFLPLSKEDFDALAPGPEVMIHVTGNSAGEAVEKVKGEWAASGRPAPEREIVFIRGRNLKMSDLETIDNALPESHYFKKGIDLGRPEGAEVEIWMFVP